MAQARTSAANVFHFVMIKPSHYDNDGYVIQWAKSSIPANSLATVYGLAQDCAQRRVLGDDVEIRLSAYDETNTRIRPRQIARQIRAAGGQGLVGLIGVQSNQYPRAMDLARQFRAEGLQVAIGGFHVSGCLAMLQELPADLQEALDLGVTLFAGEAEGRLEEIFKAAYRHELQPLYNYMKDLPSMDGVPIPYLPAHLIQRTASTRTSFDAGRGCPFLCSFCTIINVQGRRSRHRSADDVERIVRANAAQGVNNFFISDDNFARNHDWEVIYDRLIRLREQEGMNIRIIIQVDTMCHKIPRFIEKSGRAGVDRVFIGLENINPDALQEARKGQNRITEYRAMLQAWNAIGVLTYAGYILGFPNDTPETIARDIAIIQRELPVDLLEFFILTPLPGSQDHQQLAAQGVAMDPDMNKYDLEHVTTGHPIMSPEALQAIYRKAWDLYYTPEHVARVIRRARIGGHSTKDMMLKLLSFYGCVRFENIHPLEGGLWRRKYRLDRRPGLPIEKPGLFHARYGWEMLNKYARFFWMAWQYQRIRRRVERENLSKTGAGDIALQPVQEDELDRLTLYTATDAARAKVERERQHHHPKRAVAGS